MTKRIVALVLSAALTSGVVIGAAGGQLGVREALAAIGLDVGASGGGVGDSPDVEVQPAMTSVPFSFTGDLLGRTGRARVDIEVPDGWREIVKAELWRDFHDPTEELNLRIRADLTEKTPQAAAEAHQAKNADLPHYTLISLAQSQVSTVEGYLPAFELRYSYTDKGRTRYVIETFFGPGQVFLVGGYYWEGQEDAINEPMLRATEAFSYAKVR